MPFVDKFIGLAPVFVRLLGFFGIAPIFGGKRLPATFTVLLALTLTAALAPVVGGGGLSAETGTSALVTCIIGEALLGLLLGFMVQLVFSGFGLAGQITGLQLGFGIVTLFDPGSESQDSAFGQFYQLAAVLFLLLTDGHYMLIGALVRSFRAIPPGGIHWSEALGPILVTYSAKAIVLGVVIAAPVMAVMFLVNLGHGVLSRLFPQMNIFIVSMPVTIIVGFIVIISCLPLMGEMFGKGFSMSWEGIDAVLRALE
ncbi:MAG: flagellar biosynthetic protein FliR [Nitrospirota bacterium]